MQATYSCMRCKTDVGFEFDYFDQPLPHTCLHECADGEMGVAYRVSPLINNLPLGMFMAERRYREWEERLAKDWPARRLEKTLTKGHQPKRRRIWNR